MKKIVFITFAAAAALLLTSCVQTTADGMIDWGVGFKGSFSTMDEACAISNYYRTAFSSYGQIYGEEESTGGTCFILGATSKNTVNDAFVNGIEDANNRLRSERSYTISTTKPSDEYVFTVTIKAQWSDWSDSKTYYLTK